MPGFEWIKGALSGTLIDQLGVDRCDQVVARFSINVLGRDRYLPERAWTSTSRKPTVFESIQTERRLVQ